MADPPGIDIVIARRQIRRPGRCVSSGACFMPPIVRAPVGIAGSGSPGTHQCKGGITVVNDNLPRRKRISRGMSYEDNGHYRNENDS